jgi:hypothetical protein
MSIKNAFLVMGNYMNVKVNVTCELVVDDNVISLSHYHTKQLYEELKNIFENVPKEDVKTSKLNSDNYYDSLVPPKLPQRTMTDDELRNFVSGR